ncbi:MAG TPA: DUF4304 domain-containing protein [Chitinophagales bacterium]|nr:DUF4304 domain-containing protein [Chitinophagales bacterium]
MKDFKSVANEANSYLKNYGFKNHKNTLFIKKDNNWGLINFQKSNIEGNIKFTINLGVVSGALRDFFQGEKLSDTPDITDCHWGKRIGHLLPQGNDYWWQMDETANYEAIVFEIKEVLHSIAIVEIQKNITDEMLLQQWIEGSSPGITEYQRLEYLAILLKFYADDRFQMASENLIAFSQGKSIASGAKEILRLLDAPDSFPK